jgi:hypothetical protein
MNSDLIIGYDGRPAARGRVPAILIANFSTFADALDWDRFALHHAGMLALCEHLA